MQGICVQNGIDQVNLNRKKLTDPCNRIMLIKPEHNGKRRDKRNLKKMRGNGSHCWF